MNSSTYKLNILEKYKRKILITGGSGILGTSLKNVVNNLKTEDEWIFISSKDCNLINYQDTYNLFHKILPSHVIHLAVKLMNGNDMKKYPASILYENTMINTNVLKCCHDFKVKKLVSVLSSFAYPVNIKMPMNENDLHNGKYNDNLESYALSKRHLEVLSRSYCDQYNDNFVTIIPTNIYGPNQKLRSNGPVIESFIKKCINSKNTGDKIEIFSKCNAYRQFCYAPDLSKTILWVLDNYNKKDPLNITGEEVQIKEILKIISSYLNVEDKILYNIKYPDGTLYRTLSDKKIKSLYKDYKVTDIKTGIINTIDFFLDKKIN